MRVSRGTSAVNAAGMRAIANAMERSSKGGGVPRDDFDELPAVLRSGRRAARELGHHLGNWRRRVYAPNTAASAVCMTCSRLATVNLEIGSAATGPAVSERCAGA